MKLSVVGSKDINKSATFDDIRKQENGLKFKVTENSTGNFFLEKAINDADRRIHEVDLILQQDFQTFFGCGTAQSIHSSISS